MASVSVSSTGGRGIGRPSAMTGFWSWFTTVDHKKIGVLYGVTSPSSSSSSAASRRC